MIFGKQTFAVTTLSLVLVACSGDKTAPPKTEPVTPETKIVSNTAPKTQPKVQPIIENEDPIMKRGKRMFLRCRSCHTLEEGGRNGTGPNLYDIFDKKAAYHPEFKYSSAMVAAEIIWSDEAMDNWIEKPRELVPGTSMAFVGIKKAEDRAALIAYLRKATE